jgi:hypothetical protein
MTTKLDHTVTTIEGPPVTSSPEITDLFGNPLPADWCDEIAIMARQDKLRLLAYETGDAAVEVMLQYLLQRSLDGAVTRFNDAVCALEIERIRYAERQRRDAGRIIHAALEFWVGPRIAAWVEGALDRAEKRTREDGIAALERAQKAAEGRFETPSPRFAYQRAPQRLWRGL